MGGRRGTGGRLPGAIPPTRVPRGCHRPLSTLEDV